MRWKNWLLGLSVGLLLAPGVARAEDGFTMHGRVSYDEGSTFIKGTDDDRQSNATINSIVMPGDTLWVDEGGTSEVEFAGGTYFRGADGTKVEITALPPNGVLTAWEGSTYVQRLARSQGEFRVETPSARILIEPDTTVRIDIKNNGSTIVSVRTGRATVSAPSGNGAVALDTGERVFADAGLFPSEPTPFDLSDEDALDSWNRERAELLANGTRTLPKEVVVDDDTIGVSDLGHYGEWVYVDSTPVWRPTVVVNYVPYRYGYWSSVPRIGNCWVDNYPFSYVTCHYGRWNYYSDYGWCWRYDRAWSPAWVASVRCGDYYVWSPIGFDYRPVGYGGTRFSVGGVDFFVGAASYVPYSYYDRPSYITGCYPEFGTYLRNQTVINVWNINYGGRADRHIPVPYNDRVTTERDYFPRRSIRGLDSVGDSGARASDRVASIERRIGRSSFATTDRNSVREERTSIAPERRADATRRVSLRGGDREIAERANPRVARELAPRVGRPADEKTGKPADEAVPTRETVRKSAGSENGRESLRGGGEASRGDVTRGEARGRSDDGKTLTNEDARGAGPVRSDRGRTAPERAGGDATDSRTAPTERTEATPRTEVTPRSPRSDSSVSVERSPARGTTRAPEEGRSSSAPRETPQRTVVPRDVDSSRTPVNIRGRTPAGPSVDDDWVSRGRGSSTRSSAPERSEPRSIERSEPRSVERSEPRNVERSAPRNIERSEPRSVERSAPRSIERSEPTPRVDRSAPQRIEAPQAPRVERSAPQERSMPAPRIEREPRQSAPSLRSNDDGRSRGVPVPDSGGSRGSGRGRGDDNGRGR